MSGGHCDVVIIGTGAGGAALAWHKMPRNKSVLCWYTRQPAHLPAKL